MRRVYGGFHSGRPRGITGPAAMLRRTYRTVAASSGSGSVSRTTEWVFVDGTYRYPVSGSTAAPDQLAPPPTDGRMIVPRNIWGV